MKLLADYPREGVRLALLKGERRWRDVGQVWLSWWDHSGPAEHGQAWIMAPLNLQSTMTLAIIGVSLRLTDASRRMVGLLTCPGISWQSCRENEHPPLGLWGKWLAPLPFRDHESFRSNFTSSANRSWWLTYMRVTVSLPAWEPLCTAQNNIRA